MFDVEQLIALGRCQGAALSPDGTWMAVSVARLNEKKAKYIGDLWRVDLDGRVRQLTRGEHNDRAPCFRSDGSLGFLSDRTEERTQVWLLPDTGEARQLTDEPLGVDDFAFAADADRLVCKVPLVPGVALDAMREAEKDRDDHGPSILRYTAQPVRFWDHWIPRAHAHLVAYDGEGEHRVDLTPEPGPALYDTDWDVSPDGTCVITAWRRHGASDRIEDFTLVRLDVDGTHTVLRDEARTSYGSPRIAAGRVAVARDAREDGQCVSQELWVLDAATGEGERLAADWDRWPTPVGWLGDRVVVTCDDLGSVPVFSVGRGGDVRRETEGSGSHMAICVGERVVGLRHTMTHPPEPFVAEGGVARIVARLSGAPELDIAVERHTVPSDDGVDVAYFVVRGAAKGPTLLWIHGGPIGAWGDGWHWRWCPAVMVAAGYTVVLPNPRGSTGYGQDFVAGIWGNVWGAQCYRDLVAVTDAIAARPDVDGQRICAMGGSFGGYMTNWIGGQTDRYKCLVTHASLYDLSAFYGVTDHPAWWAFEIGEHPYGDPDSHDRYSPHRYVTHWKSPTLILHGEKDYRVPIGEGIALFEALQLHGVDSELVVFPDENHWILKPRNIVAWYQTVLEFLRARL